MALSALHASLAICHLISNARSWKIVDYHYKVLPSLSNVTLNASYVPDLFNYWYFKLSGIILLITGTLFKTRCTKCHHVEENRNSPIVPALLGKG